MKTLMIWVFQSPRRLFGTAAASVLVVMTGVALVLALRINAALDDVGRARADPMATTIATLAPVATGTLTTRDQEYLNQTPDAFADLGDPRPRAQSAVAAWIRGDLDAMQEIYLPAALDDAVGSPPAPGFRIQGEPWVESGGPTRAVILARTNGPLLEIVMVGADDVWMVESIGYRS